MPQLHQVLAQIIQLDIEHTALHSGRAQRGVGMLQLDDVLLQCRGMAPHQHFGKVIQKCGHADHPDIRIPPVHGKTLREMPGPLGPAHQIGQPP